MDRRNTKQRQIVLEAVQNRMDHPTADQIYLDVRKIDSHISRGTVYRNLNVLSQNGDILHIKVPTADRFDLRTDKHYHIICTACDKVFDVPQGYSDCLDTSTAVATGFMVSRHRTVFEGVCPECQLGKEDGGLNYE